MNPLWSGSTPQGTMLKTNPRARPFSMHLIAAVASGCQTTISWMTLEPLQGRPWSMILPLLPLIHVSEPALTGSYTTPPSSPTSPVVHHLRLGGASALPAIVACPSAQVPSQPARATADRCPIPHRWQQRPRFAAATTAVVSHCMVYSR